MKDKESSDNIPKRKIRIQTRWIIAIFLLGALILLPAILKFVFSIDISSDWLGYYGTCLATIGTVFLGAVAVWQNSIIHKKEMAIQAKNAIEKISAAKPLLKGLNGSFTNGTLRMNICIKNESNNVAKILKIHSAEIIDVANNIHCMDISEFPLAAGSEFSPSFIRMDNPKYIFDGFELFQFTIDYEDVYGNLYSTIFLYICNIPELQLYKYGDGIPYSANKRTPNKGIASGGIPM